MCHCGWRGGGTRQRVSGVLKIRAADGPERRRAAGGRGTGGGCPACAALYAAKADGKGCRDALGERASDENGCHRTSAVPCAVRSDRGGGVANGGEDNGT